MTKAISFENVGKLYNLGLVGTGTFTNDVYRWFKTSVLGQEDPYMKVGETNDRSKAGNSKFVWALRDITFDVEEGDVVGIIGKNGAGKSTLLKLLSRVTAPTSGIIRAKGRIASLLEVGTGFHPELTGRENIYMNGAILGMTKSEIRRKLDEIVDFSGCERYIDTPVKRYSSGMMVRLGFAVAAHLEPEIMVVDEVLAVGDAEFQKKAIGKMKDVSKGDGRTVLFVSHNMASIRSLCNNGVVLKDGSVDFQGTAEESVEYYMNNLSVSNEFVHREVDSSIRMKDLPLFVEFLTVGFLKEKNKFVIDEPIEFVFEIKGNRDAPNCRINMTVTGTDDISVGTVSNEFHFAIKKGEVKKVCIKIYDCHFAVGQYKVNFSVGSGDMYSGQKDYDILLNALAFCVEPLEKQDDTSERYITQWNNSWGRIMLPHETYIV